MNDLKSQSIKICLNNGRWFEYKVSNLLQNESDQNIIHKTGSVSHSSSQNESDSEDSQSETETVRPSTSKQKSSPTAVSSFQSNANQTLRSESNQNPKAKKRRSQRISSFKIKQPKRDHFSDQGEDGHLNKKIFKVINFVIICFLLIIRQYYVLYQK